MIKGASVEDYVDIDSIIDGLVKLGQEYKLLPNARYINLTSLRQDTEALVDKSYTRLYLNNWEGSHRQWHNADKFIGRIQAMWFPGHNLVGTESRVMDFTADMKDIFVGAGIPKQAFY